MLGGGPQVSEADARQPGQIERFDLAHFAGPITFSCASGPAGSSNRGAGGSPRIPAARLLWDAIQSPSSLAALRGGKPDPGEYAVEAGIAPQWAEEGLDRETVGNRAPCVRTRRSVSQPLAAVR